MRLTLLISTSVSEHIMCNRNKVSDTGDFIFLSYDLIWKYIHRYLQGQYFSGSIGLLNLAFRSNLPIWARS